MRADADADAIAAAAAAASSAARDARKLSTYAHVHTANPRRNGHSFFFAARRFDSYADRKSTAEPTSRRKNDAPSVTRGGAASA